MIIASDSSFMTPVTFNLPSDTAFLALPLVAGLTAPPPTSSPPMTHRVQILNCARRSSPSEQRTRKLIAMLRLTFVLLEGLRRDAPPTPPCRRRQEATNSPGPSTGHERFSGSESLCVSSAFRQRDTTRGSGDEECELDDVSSCPQSHPQQLTADERETIKDMVLSEDYRHIPTGVLAILARTPCHHIRDFSDAASSAYTRARTYETFVAHRQQHPDDLLALGGPVFAAGANDSVTTQKRIPPNSLD